MPYYRRLLPQSIMHRTTLTATQESGWSLVLCGLLFAIPSLNLQCMANPIAEENVSDEKVREQITQLPSELTPRKVTVGTLMSSSQKKAKTLSERIAVIESLIDRLAVEADRKYPGEGLDLVILPENALSPNSPREASKRAVRLAGEIQDRMGSKARQYDTNLIATMILDERQGERRIYSNAAVLFDRTGTPIGIYRKYHPVAYLGSSQLEGGVTPGSEFPVFKCDFGRLGIQICWDMSYEDGWLALAQQGAEIIALPTASAQTVRPAFYALRGQCYVATSTGRGNASVFNPIGTISAQTTQSPVLVHQVDLSYAILHWSSKLHGGQVLKDRFGDRIGFEYSHTEDTGLFWSNDSQTTIREMVRELGLEEMGEQVERCRYLQDAARQPSRAE